MSRRFENETRELKGGFYGFSRACIQLVRYGLIAGILGAGTWVLLDTFDGKIESDTFETCLEIFLGIAVPLPTLSLISYICYALSNVLYQQSIAKLPKSSDH